MKEKKIYSSYDEIDRDLEILKLERKLHYYKVKQGFEDLKSHLTLGNVAKNALGIAKVNVKPIASTVFRAALPFLAQKAFGLFRKK